MPKNLEYILDASIVLAYVLGENSALKLQEILSRSAVPFIVLTETYYLLLRRRGRAQADQTLTVMSNWPVEFLYPDQKICLLAAELKALNYLGIADSFIAAFALEHSATLITKDPDYKILQPQLKLLKF